MRPTNESRAALPAARDWLEGHYGVRHALTVAEVIGDVNRHYPGGWAAFDAWPPEAPEVTVKADRPPRRKDTR